MRTQARDVSVVAETIMFDRYRRMSESDSLRELQALIDLAVAFQRSNIAAEHPDADSEEIRMRVLSQWLSPEAMLKAYGWEAT